MQIPDAMSRAGVGRRRLLGMCAGTLLAASAPSQAAVLNGCVVGKDGWLFPIWDRIRLNNNARLRSVTQPLISAAEILKASGIEVVFSITPSKSRVYRHYLPDDVRWGSDAELRYRLALEDLRGSGHLAPDQAAYFDEVRGRGPETLLFLKADTHWTGEGAEQAALLVGREIKSKLNIPASKSLGMTLAPASLVTQEHNDLAALLPPEDRSRFPSQSCMVRKPALQDERSLMSEEQPDILVLGNSFMQPVYGFSTVLSEQLQRPVELSWKVHQFSPYWSMLNVVRRDGVRNQKPRVIVWSLEESDFLLFSDDADSWGQTVMSSRAFLSGLRDACST